MTKWRLRSRVLDADCEGFDPAEFYNLFGGNPAARLLQALAPALKQFR